MVRGACFEGGCSFSLLGMGDGFREQLWAAGFLGFARNIPQGTGA